MHTRLSNSLPLAEARTGVPLFALEEASQSFDEGRIVALNSVSLAIAPGECVAILGRSGSGKSCLVNMMTGIDAPRSGRVLWRGQVMSSRTAWTRIRHDHIGIVFQDFNLFATLTALENVELALFERGLMQAERRRRAEAALELVGLKHRRHHVPAALSGGERQRVAIARAIVHAPDLLIADEPTGSLDSATGKAIADVLFRLRAELGVTLVIVTHDEALAQRCPRCVRLLDGRLVADETTGAGLA